MRLPSRRKKTFLLLLLPCPFELATWKIATVVLNYHFLVDKMNYSVPCEYVKQKVDVRVTRSTVEVFYDGNRICFYRRLYGRANRYSTIEQQGYKACMGLFKVADNMKAVTFTPHPSLRTYRSSFLRDRTRWRRTLQPRPNSLQNTALPEESDITEVRSDTVMKTLYETLGEPIVKKTGV